MSSDWFDEISNSSLSDGEQEAFYCPYTNTAECALLTKGWQPQELCLALECEQVKQFQRNQRSGEQNRAA